FDIPDTLLSGLGRSFSTTALEVTTPGGEIDCSARCVLCRPDFARTQRESPGTVHSRAPACPPSNQSGTRLAPLPAVGSMLIRSRWIPCQEDERKLDRIVTTARPFFWSPPCPSKLPP